MINGISLFLWLFHCMNKKSFSTLYLKMFMGLKLERKKKLKITKFLRVARYSYKLAIVYGIVSTTDDMLSNFPKTIRIFCK